MSDTLERKTFDFLSILTGVVVLVYIGVAVYAFVARLVDWKEFASAVGLPAGTLLGYWVKGRQ